MATNKVTPIQVLRSEVLNKRPDPTKMLAGQPAVNIAAAQPGLFFADDTGNALFKVGPCTVGTLPPNDPLIAPVGAPGNTVGELWLDLNGDPPLFPGPVLKVWDGVNWVNCFPSPTIYATPIISDTAPALVSHPNGTLWWDSSSGLMYILYQDTAGTRQWTQVSGNPVP
jgi:hypothetical protein